MITAMTLKNIISFNKEFRSGINLYLSLNSIKKIETYIPTNSSLRILDEYVRAVLKNKEQATLLIGPYGKGKSHLLLVLLAILTLPRTDENRKVLKNLIERISADDDFRKQVVEDIESAWSQRPLLPVVLNSTSGNLNQAFLLGLNDALKRANLLDLVPDTYYSIALQRINEWADKYPDTYVQFKNRLIDAGINIDEFIVSLKRFAPESLKIFREIYPTITSGSEFNPLVASDVLPLYKEISEQLVENYGFSGIYIVFDEFSKFIEGQNGKLVGNNMKLLQDICELATDSRNAKVYVTLIAHKSIKEYGKFLSQDIINAFTGIEGRVIEKYFVTSSKNSYELIKNAIIKQDDFMENIPGAERIFSEANADEYYEMPAFRSNFRRDDFINIIFRGCYPLNPIASYLLLNVSEKVAQNERTLFTFISNDEPNSLARYVRNHCENDEWIVGADLIYDYFKGLFKKDVTNELVHNIWLSAEYALGKCETVEEKKVVKALAIILAVNKEDELPATEKYIKLSVTIENGEIVIEKLKQKGLIYKKGSTDAFVFKTRAGSVLKSEIKRQRELIGTNVNYSDALRKISGQNYVLPRKFNADHLMTRYFHHEYMSVESFLNINEGSVFIDKDCIDGKVITLYSFNDVKQNEVKKHVVNLSCDQLVIVAPGKNLTVQRHLTDYAIIQGFRKENIFKGDNEILKRELSVIEEDLEQEIENVLSDVYGKESDTRVFYFKNGSFVEAHSGSEEKAVNECCESLYTACPIINNEIINRNKITSAQTKKARINIITALLSHTDTPEFYAGTNQEATVYRSLFIRTGIKGELPTDRNLAKIIEKLNLFIDNCADRKVSMNGIINELISKPYGLRRGIVPVYLAYVFSERKEDLIFYLSGSEVQLDANVVVNMTDSPSEYSLYVSKEDVQKEKYIGEFNTLFGVNETHNLTTNRIKNIVICMQRWFRALPQVTRNLTNINLIDKLESRSSAMSGLKNLLQKVEINPYEMLFISLPEIYGSDELSVITENLSITLTDFDDYLDYLLDLIVEDIYKIFGNNRKQGLYHVLKEWYLKQSTLSKEALHSGKVTSFMSFIGNLNIYDDREIAKRMAKVVTDVYIENWADGTVDEFKETLADCKSEVETIKDTRTGEKLKLSFVGHNGNVIEKYYDKAPEGTGTVLRNIIEDALDEYDDLSVNDRVSILLDMVEKIIG